MRRSISIALPLFFVASLFVACKKDPPPPAPIVEAPPAPTPSAPVELAPLVEDAGSDADAAEAGKKATGGGTSGNSRIKECCNALRAQAKALGPSPEGAQLQSLAAMCDTAASGNAPELAPLKALMQGKAVPPICRF